MLARTTNLYRQGIWMGETKEKASAHISPFSVPRGGSYFTRVRAKGITAVAILAMMHFDDTNLADMMTLEYDMSISIALLAVLSLFSTCSSRAREGYSRARVFAR